MIADNELHVYGVDVHKYNAAYTFKNDRGSNICIAVASRPWPLSISKQLKHKTQKKRQNGESNC